MTTKAKKTKAKLLPATVLEIHVDTNRNPGLSSFVTYKFPSKAYITKTFDVPGDALQFAGGLFDAAKEDKAAARMYVDNELTRMTFKPEAI